jgi:hypothetical protein
MSKIQEAETEASSLRAIRRRLSELNTPVQRSTEALARLDRELRETTDKAQRDALNAERTRVLRERRAAADDLKAYREQHEIEQYSDLDFQISELESEIGKLRDELNPKPAAAIDESLPLGGRWYDVEPQGGEVHHMPAQDATPSLRLSPGKGPSIRMETGDHQLTKSWGRRTAAIAWRNTQASLIAQGKFLEAVAMDIADVRRAFGGKYEKGIQQMLDYIEKSPDIAALNRNSALKVSDLRTPPAASP